LLISFSNAVIGNNLENLNKIRCELVEKMGQDALVAAASVAGNFSKNDRIANALGIPIEPMMIKATKEVRKRLNLDSFRSAINTFRHYSNE
jgi:hypothetical protein